MSHTHSKIWIHFVWTTKNRISLIDKKIEPILYDFMYEQFIESGCRVSIINGMPDHIHCLILLNQNISIANVIKQVKGSSAHFVNQNKLIKEKFNWQKGYGAFSVSEKSLKNTYQYIKMQKVIHNKRYS
ncbi:MAG: IS200/IS605 family transposase, partial [Flavobacterium sp.]|nr:IS200/IS605 family transposase [Flavobacterium sp.]